jgi:hypothetical protein
MHIFSNYGHPLSVFRTRNKLQQPIAFVEFETQWLTLNCELLANWFFLNLFFLQI